MNLEENLIEEVKAKMSEVPFGNSQFQIKQLIAPQEGDARTYRNVLLQMNQKLDALQEAKFARDLLNVDIDELETKIEQCRGAFENRRNKIELERKQWQLSSQVKYIEDAIVELNTYKDCLDELPTFTRDEFENQEKTYWVERFTRDAQLESSATGRVGLGTLKSLDAIGKKPVVKDNRIDTEDKNKQLEN
jgi:flagellar biosynthesis chaperone FliJ